jgi:hypothetical protein
MRKAVHWMVALACGVFRAAGAGPGGGLDQAAVEEYRLKAAFVSSFAGFIAWPADALKNPGDAIVICVLGEDPFGSALDQAVSGKAVQDHKLIARRIADVRQASGCQILFIASSERRRLHGILKEVQASAILTVGDTDNFTSEGGMINLHVEGDRIRILVNMDAAELGRLHISSKLLSLARIVRK